MKKYAIVIEQGEHNPSAYVPDLSIPRAKAQDFRPASQRIYRGGAEGSRLRFQVVQ